MSAGRQNQIENKLAVAFATAGNRPWRMVRNSHKKDKLVKHKRERRRARIDPDAPPEYRKYHGWEY